MAVFYEITADVTAELCEEYESYMARLHIPEVLATGAFCTADLSRSAPGRYRVRFEANSREDLGLYLKRDAPRLRAHFQKTFPVGIDLYREEWELMEEFAASDFS